MFKKMEKHKWKINVINQKRFKNASKNKTDNYIETITIMKTLKINKKHLLPLETK